MSRLLLRALLLLLPVVGHAQEWRQGAAIDLVARAATERTRRDADRALTGWEASARGVVQFVALVDHGTGPIARVIRTDELRLQVYGEAPNRSKQVITAWRDTILLPTSIVYHRDHLGIVANDFGPVIRIGEGDEVRDVPHPLSPAGLSHYLFQVRDTLRLESAGRMLQVVRVAVRPADEEAAGVVGMLDLDVDRAMVVRFAFTFTRAAYRDPTVSAIAVHLENALQDGVLWLPWRQGIEIRRASPWIALALETAIRSHWEIDDYRLGVTHPAGRLAGLTIDGLRRPDRAAEWAQPFAPETVAPGDDVMASTAKARDLVTAATLDGLSRVRFLAEDGLSSVLRVNRVEGVRLAAALRWQGPGGLAGEATGGVGLAGGLVTGSVSLQGHVHDVVWALGYRREVVSRETWPRRSGTLNSLATALVGDDAGDWYLHQGVGLTAGIDAGGRTLAVAIRRERTTPLHTRFTAIDGTRTDNPILGVGSSWRGSVELSARRTDGIGWTVSGEVADGDASWWRLSGSATCTLPAGVRCLVQGGLGPAGLPAHRRFVTGGAGAVPGTDARTIRGHRFLRMEVERPIPLGIGAPMGGEAAKSLTSWVVPFVGVAAAGDDFRSPGWTGQRGVEPFFGGRLRLWGPLLQLEVGWNPRRDTWTVGFDAHPDWWPLL